MTLRLAAITLLLPLVVGVGGCATIPTAVLSAGLTLGAQALHLDAAIIEYFTAEKKAEKPSPAP